MKMKKETTANAVGGSITSVIPLILVDLKNIKKGDKLIWDIEINNDKISIDITPKKASA
jgi:hypothetical protein